MINSKKLTWGLLAFYVLALTWIIVFKFQFSLQGLDRFRNINLIPFGASTMNNGVIDFSEIRDNALAFVPYGVLVFTLAQRKAFLKMVAPIFLTSLFYEIVQYILGIGGSDITDLIANTTGGIVGIGIGFLMFRIFKDKAHKIVNIVALVAAILLFALMGMLLLSNS